MTATHKNFLKTTISAVASAGLGAFTISTASSGYRTFGAGDDGLTFDGVTIKEGTTWEVRDGCVYTHSGTSLSRGTLQDSSTGSAIAFTSAAVVQQGDSAGLANRMESAGLNSVTSSADANITMTVGTLHCVDISGYTANRTATLPAVAAVDDRCGIYITTGDNAYELIYTAASGDTLGGVAGGTEKSRLFISGELVVFRCIVANTTWIVEIDGRIPLNAMMYKTTETTVSTSTVTKILLNAIADENATGFANTTNNRFDIRRASKFVAIARIGAAGTAITGHQTRLGNAGGTDAVAAFAFDITAAGSCPNPAFSFSAAADSYVELNVYHTSGADRNYWYEVNAMSLRLMEVLT